MAVPLKTILTTEWLQAQPMNTQVKYLFRSPELLAEEGLTHLHVCDLIWMTLDNAEEYSGPSNYLVGIEDSYVESLTAHTQTMSSGTSILSALFFMVNHRVMEDTDFPRMLGLVREGQVLPIDPDSDVVKNRLDEQLRFLQDVVLYRLYSSANSFTQRDNSAMNLDLMFCFLKLYDTVEKYFEGVYPFSHHQDIELSDEGGDDEGVSPDDPDDQT